MAFEGLIIYKGGFICFDFVGIEFSRGEGLCLNREYPPNEESSTTKSTTRTIH